MEDYENAYISSAKYIIIASTFHRPEKRSKELIYIKYFGGHARQK